MGEKQYKWFLQEICNTHLCVKILETGICRGTKVINWYCNTLTDSVVCKTTRFITKTKYLINFFLNQRVPILEEYAPEKLICYLYHKDGKKLVSAKEAVELAENQLHGLQVTSIHMAIMNSPEIIHVIAINIGWELKTEVFLVKFGKPPKSPLKDPATIEKIVNLLVFLSDYIVKIAAKEIKEIFLDLLKGPSDSLYIIKITRLVLSEIKNGFIRKSSIKVVEHSSSSDEDCVEEIARIQNKLPFSSINEKAKEKDKKNVIKIPIAKPSKNIEPFLQMIANTFDRERKKYDNAEILTMNSGHKPTQSLEKKKNRTSSIFQIHTRNSYRESAKLKKSLHTIDDLLFYVEKTRPRIWIKDSVSPYIKKTPSINLVSTNKTPKPKSLNYLTSRHKVSSVDLLLSDNNRIKTKMHKYSYSKLSL